MFADTGADVAERLQFAAHAFRVTYRSEDAAAIKHAKGMAFVSMYAAYEFSLCTAVRATLIELNRCAVPHCELREGLLAFAFDDHLRSIRDVPHGNWLVRHDIFTSITSNSPAAVSDILFPYDGTHYRRGQIETIWLLFGIDAPIVPKQRLLGLADELVENRNAITHGRRTAEDVGRSYTALQIEGKISDTRMLCHHILQSMSAYCSNPANFRRVATA